MKNLAPWRMNLPEPVRVRVLSDDERIRQSALTLPSNYSVELFDQPLAALAAIELDGDIAIIELGLGGYGITHDIRERAGREVKVVMICSRPQDRWLCRQAGADDVLVKPLRDPSVLTDAIDRLNAA